MIYLNLKLIVFYRSIIILLLVKVHTARVSNAFYQSWLSILNKIINLILKTQIFNHNIIIILLSVKVHTTNGSNSLRTYFKKLPIQSEHWLRYTSNEILWPSQKRHFFRNKWIDTFPLHKLKGIRAPVYTLETIWKDYKWALN